MPLFLRLAWQALQSDKSPGVRILSAWCRQRQRWNERDDEAQAQAGAAQVRGAYRAGPLLLGGRRGLARLDTGAGLASSCPASVLTMG